MYCHCFSFIGVFRRHFCPIASPPGAVSSRLLLTFCTLISVPSALSFDRYALGDIDQLHPSIYCNERHFDSKSIKFISCDYLHKMRSYVTVKYHTAKLVIWLYLIILTYNAIYIYQPPVTLRSIWTPVNIPQSPSEYIAQRRVWVWRYSQDLEEGGEFVYEAGEPVSQRPSPSLTIAEIVEIYCP